MKYRSTRGGINVVSFSKALLSGRAPDGGLYVPESIPRLTRVQLKEWSDFSYIQIVERVLRYFVSTEELPSSDFPGILNGCLSTFSHPESMSIVSLGPYRVLELMHGPTGAFKDYPYTIMARLVSYFLKKNGEKAVALVSTFGDSGSAAMHSIKNIDNIRMVVLYPKQSAITEIQRLQMATMSSPNLRLYACDGDCDSLDPVLDQVFRDDEFVSRYNLYCPNSVNITRMILHIAHFVYSYLKLCPSVDREVMVYVPSGALGNFTGAYLSMLFGLPIKPIAAVNENDILHRCMLEGKLAVGKLFQTYSCAMDTQIPLNIERIFYFMSGSDALTIKRIMETFGDKGTVDIPTAIMSVARSCITSARVPQEEATAAATKIWREYGYVLCPHTAVGVAAALRMGESGLSLCLATATAAKFPEFVSLFGAPVPSHPAMEGLQSKPCYDLVMKKGQDWDRILRKAVEELYHN